MQGNRPLTGDLWPEHYTRRALEAARTADERAAALARELLPIRDRLVPALEAAIPDLASVLHDAKPALKNLAKGPGSRRTTTLTVAGAQSSPRIGSEQPAAVPGVTDDARA